MVPSPSLIEFPSETGNLSLLVIPLTNDMLIVFLEKSLLPALKIAADEASLKSTILKHTLETRLCFNLVDTLFIPKGRIPTFQQCRELLQHLFADFEGCNTSDETQPALSSLLHCICICHPVESEFFTVLLLLHNGLIMILLLLNLILILKCMRIVYWLAYWLKQSILEHRVTNWFSCYIQHNYSEHVRLLNLLVHLWHHILTSWLNIFLVCSLPLCNWHAGIGYASVENSCPTPLKIQLRTPITTSENQFNMLKIQDENAFQILDSSAVRRCERQKKHLYCVVESSLTFLGTHCTGWSIKMTLAAIKWGNVSARQDQRRTWSKWRL